MDRLHDKENWSEITRMVVEWNLNNEEGGEDRMSQRLKRSWGWLGRHGADGFKQNGLTWSCGCPMFREKCPPLILIQAWKEAANVRTIINDVVFVTKILFWFVLKVKHRFSFGVGGVGWGGVGGGLILTLGVYILYSLIEKLIRRRKYYCKPDNILLTLLKKGYL